MAGVETKGAEVVVVGRSNLVGKPISMMLVQKEANANATVTMCHTATRDLAAHTRKADILIVAAGKAGAITADWAAGIERYRQRVKPFLIYD